MYNKHFINRRRFTGGSFWAVASVAAHDLATLSHRRGSTIVPLATYPAVPRPPTRLSSPYDTRHGPRAHWLPLVTLFTILLHGWM